MITKGLKGIAAAETSISYIDGEKGKLVYRGYDAKYLALNKSFEEVSFILWHGRFPDASELSELKQKMKEYRKIPSYVQRILEDLPSNMNLMEALRTAVSALGTDEFGWNGTVEQAVQLTSILPSLIAFRYRLMSGEKPVSPLDHLHHAENYLYMLTGGEPQPVHARALEAYMILTMEHGMNASTFAARVISSTESDMVSALTGALGAMKGPLHGGAPSGVTAMLDQIGKKENAEGWLRNKLAKNERIMGFGHRVYKTHDPRAQALSNITRSIGKDDKWLDLAGYVEEVAIKLLDEYKPGRKLYTNVEFYAAAVMKSIEMHEELFTPTFSAGRTAGWTAHILEQGEDNTLYRPEAIYKGVFTDIVRK
ncbi:citrate synthase/methylcitrate synthase [Peribacillus kribbensis]|uniref:citrate synthase/methylcitrate synthase n=1 Tax=Peribacillus kribbensis TaxID=356658 RepID=UPI00041FF062|nr:citrate synthase/methylcitrate synthase [Peribacillus kribbensis]